MAVRFDASVKKSVSELMTSKSSSDESHPSWFVLQFAKGAGNNNATSVSVASKGKGWSAFVDALTKSNNAKVSLISH